MRRMPELITNLLNTTGQRHQEDEVLVGIGIGWPAQDGHDVPIEVSFGETNSNGQRIFSAIIRDISQRKRSEQTIKSTKIRLENLIRTLQAVCAG